MDVFLIRLRRKFDVCLIQCVCKDIYINRDLKSQPSRYKVLNYFIFFDRKEDVRFSEKDKVTSVILNIRDL